MPLLIFYRPSDGQIVSSTRVNKNHSINNFPPKIQRLLEHSEELKLRHILIEDRISPAGYMVKESSTGLSVVRKDESDPLWLEPLLTITGDLPELKRLQQQDLVQVRYVTPAAANPEYVRLQPGITIFVPTRARWYCAIDFFESLKKLKMPKGVNIRLVLYDNSLDPTFGGLCKWFLASLPNNISTSYIRDEEQPTSDRQGTVKAVSRIYGRMTHLVDTEFVLTLEDDVIMSNENILIELYDELRYREKAAAIGANVIERTDHRTMCWSLSGDIPMIKYESKTDSLQKVDGISFSCTLWRMKLLKMVAVRPQRKHEGSFFATDITLCADLRDRGFHCLMNWNLHCAHIEPWQKFVPFNHFPFYKRENYNPSKRGEVSEHVGSMIGLPTKTSRKLSFSGITTFFQKKEAKRLCHLIIFHIQDKIPKQFFVNLQQVRFPKDSIIIVYGPTDQDLWEKFNVQYIDDWEILSQVISAAEKVTWWNTNVVLHPHSAQKIFSAEEFTITDLPSEDAAIDVANRICDIWTSPLSIDSSNLISQETFVEAVNYEEPITISVEGSRWIPKSEKWIPEEGYKPGELPIKEITPLAYYGKHITLDEKLYPLDVSIAVTCINHPEMTQKAIESLLETTEHLKREIMVWDNCSTDPQMGPMLDQYQNHPTVQVFRSQTNRGYIHPMNFLSKRSVGKFLVISNNDIIAHPGWFESLKKPFDQDERVAQTAPTPEYGHLTHDFLGTGGEGEPDYLEGFFFMVSRWVLNRFPVFDEDHLTFATCEDADLTLRLREIGCRTVACPSAKIEHLRSVTRLKDDEIRERMNKTEEQNRKYMLTRWGNYLKTRTFPQHQVLVQRKGANGDVLSCEGAFKGLRWKYPYSRITLATECIEIIKDCPWVDEIRSVAEVGVDYNVVCNLDNAYEDDLRQNRPKIISKRAKVPFVTSGYWVIDGAKKKIEKRFKDKGPMIAFHWKAGWVNRRWPKERWSKLAERLCQDYHLVEVGGVDDERLEVGEHFYGKPWEHVAALYHMCEAVVCVDSVSLHIATGVQTPTVCLFGTTKPELVIENKYLYSVTVDKLDCLGCHHEPPYPKMHSSCRHPQLYCMLGLTVCAVHDKVLEALGKANNDI